MPEESWWKLYINPADHPAALATSPQDPGRLYDLEKSPGYQASMVKAYREILDSAGPGGPVDADMYERMHDLVTGSLLSPTSWSRGVSLFTIGESTLAADILDERIAGKPLIRRMEWDKPYTPVKQSDIDAWAELAHAHAVLQPPDIGPYIRSSVRNRDEGRRLVSAILARYYTEVAAAPLLTGKLEAVARAIRALHVIHPFNDTNGRLNISLLLQKLLLDQGVGPAVLPQMSYLFNGIRTVEQIAFDLAFGVVRPTPGPPAPGAFPLLPRSPKRGEGVRLTRSDLSGEFLPAEPARIVRRGIAVYQGVDERGGTATIKDNFAKFRSDLEARRFYDGVSGLLAQLESEKTGAALVRALGLTFPLPEGVHSVGWGGGSDWGGDSASSSFFDAEGNPIGVTVLIGPMKPGTGTSPMSAGLFSLSRGRSGLGAVGFIALHPAFPTISVSTHPGPGDIVPPDVQLAVQLNHVLTRLSGASVPYDLSLPEDLPLRGESHTIAYQFLAMGSPAMRAKALAADPAADPHMFDKDTAANASAVNAVIRLRDMITAFRASGEPSRTAAAEAMEDMVAIRVGLALGHFAVHGYAVERGLEPQTHLQQDRPPDTPPRTPVAVPPGTPGSPEWVRALRDMTRRYQEDTARRINPAASSEG